MQAAGSSLLYSKEFYALAKRRLHDGGILQQWLPWGDSATTASVAGALAESFPYVRAFGSVEGWGIHFLASMTPIPSLSAAELAAKLPAAAVHDLREWAPDSSPEAQFAIMLSHEQSVAALIQRNPNVPALEDDRPINEYYMLRHFWDSTFRQKLNLRFLGRSQLF